MKPSCANCDYLRRCKLVTAHKIETGYKCEDWAKGQSVELKARETIIKDFGLWALRFEVENLKKKKRRPMARRRRKDG